MNTADRSAAQTDDASAAFVAASAAMLGLKIRPEWREAVLTNMKAIAAAAALVHALPLDDDLEAAPVYRV